MMSSIFCNSATAVRENAASVSCMLMFHCAKIMQHADPDLPSVLAEAVGSAQLPWSKICSNC
jgi:hypothetical protein